MRSALLLGFAAAALGAAGCEPLGSPYDEQASVLGSVRPLVHLSRTHLARELEMEGDMALELAVTRNSPQGDVLAAFIYLPLNERNTGRDVRCYLLDALISERLSLAGENRGLPVYFRFGLGWSLLYMDFEEDSNRDTWALGAVTRMGVGVQFTKFAGIEAFGDLHGWGGMDEDRVQGAWAASVGLTVYVAF